MIKIRKMLILLLPILIFTACMSKEEDRESPQKEVINVSKKPISSKINIKNTSFASSIILDNMQKKPDNEYKVTKVSSMDELESGDFDVAVVDADQVVNIYNSTDQSIKLAAITLLNNIKIISDKQINLPTDMAGKTIMVSSSDIFAKVIEDKIGMLKALMKINIENYDTMADLSKALPNKENVIAVISEPFYSKAIEDKEYYIFDLDSILSTIDQNEDSVNGDILSEAIIVNNDYLKDNKESFDKFLSEYKKSQSEIGINTSINNDIINYYDITNAKALEIFQSLDHSFIDKDTMKGVFEVYMDKLESLNKNIFGGKRPSDNLYYTN